MEILPKDVLQRLALGLSLGEVNKLCKSSRRFNELICNSNIFWTNKLYKDFAVKRERDAKEVYQKIIQNREFCKYLNNKAIDNGYMESFLQTIPNFLDDTTNARISDILVFNYLVMKYLKQDMGQPTLFDITYDRYIKKYNTEYNNRITRGEVFTPQEAEVLREIMYRFKYVFSTSVVEDERKQFLSDYLNSILQGRIPFETSLRELCKYNIY